MKTIILLFFLTCQIGASQNLYDVIDEYQDFIDKNAKLLKSSWPISSVKEYEKKAQVFKGILTELQSIKSDKLSKDDLINKDLLEYVVKDEIANLEYQSYLFPLSAEGGFITDIIYGMQYASLESKGQKDNYLKKLNAIPKFIEAKIALLRIGMNEEKMMPKVIVGNCIKMISKFLSEPVEEHFLLTTVTKQLDDAAFQNLTKSTIQQKLYPSYEKLKTFLTDEYLIKAPQKTGANQMKDGARFYEQRIRYYTSFDISPNKVYEIGLSEVARIKAEMQNIIEELEFDGDYASFLQFLRTEPRFYPESGDALIRYASFLSKKIERQLPKFFGKLPRMPFTVVPVPSAIAENYTTGRYSPGSYEKQKAGEYWVNTTKLKSRTLYTLPALTLHEAVPGHHLQIMLAAEIEDLPKFRRSTYLSAYGEGWGLYSEWLGLEAGMYSDPYDNFGRLTYEMWRACRLVVDVGLHYKDWTRQEALDYMASNTALSMHEVTTEIDRYIGWPGQAVSYKMGELKIKELRKMAENQLGEAFDIRSFHDCILANGSILLSSLESEVNDYISQRKE